MTTTTVVQSGTGQGRPDKDVGKDRYMSQVLTLPRVPCLPTSAHKCKWNVCAHGTTASFTPTIDKHADRDADIYVHVVAQSLVVPPLPMIKNSKNSRN